MKNRAMRRHHRTRIAKNRSRYWGRDISGCSRLMGIVINTPHPCSCWQCGNQRKIAGPTRKEMMPIVDDFLSDLADNIKDGPLEFQKTVDENFWDLI